MLDKVYVVHYSKLIDRKNSIANIFRSKIDIEFLEEFDKEFVEEYKSKYNDLNYKEYVEKSSIYKDFLFGVPPLRQLSDGEISCAVKHINCLKKIQESQEIALVIEDDVIPYNNEFLMEIEDLLKNIPDDWDAIFIGTGCGMDFINKVRKVEVKNNIFKVFHPATNCAESYIINPKSVDKILNKIIPFQLPYDCELACVMGILNMNVYWHLPPIFYQGSVNGEYISSLR